MSKKLILIAVVTIAIIAITPLLVAFAAGTIRYEAYETGVKIFFNGKEIEFDLPVVTINNHTYIPLREAAEKADVGVEWNGEDNTIMLTGNSHGFDVQNVFENLFEFALPDTAEILNYDYFIEYEEQYFTAKISFNGKDLEYIKNSFFKTVWMELEDWKFLSYNGNKYPWWDLSDTSESTCAYHRFKSGVEKKTVEVCFFITEGPSDQYYLYVSYI